MTVDQLQAELERLDDGVLTYGDHRPGRAFCALEFESQVRKRNWSDTSITLPDIRPLNDAFGVGQVADKARTQALLPLMAALWDWSLWPASRRDRYLEIVLVNTTTHLVATLPFFVEHYPLNTPPKTKQDVMRWADRAAWAGRRLGLGADRAAWAGRRLGLGAAEAAEAAKWVARAARATGAVGAAKWVARAAGAVGATRWAAEADNVAGTDKLHKILTHAVAIWMDAVEPSVE